MTLTFFVSMVSLIFLVLDIWNLGADYPPEKLSRIVALGVISVIFFAITVYIYKVSHRKTGMT